MFVFVLFFIFVLIYQYFFLNIYCGLRNDHEQTGCVIIEYRIKQPMRSCITIEPTGPRLYTCVLGIHFIQVHSNNVFYDLRLATYVTMHSVNSLDYLRSSIRKRNETCMEVRFTHLDLPRNATGK